MKKLFFHRNIASVILATVLTLCLLLTAGCTAVPEQGSAGVDSSAAAVSTQGSSVQEYDASAGESDHDAVIRESGVYFTKDEVADYLHLYHHLPSNYITKAQARDLGWEGGAVEPYAPGMAIGGDVFGNYEGNLPEDHTYHECDIDTQGRPRGAKRLVWSDDWSIYYTEDHYETFELLYTDEDE